MRAQPIATATDSKSFAPAISTGRPPSGKRSSPKEHRGAFTLQLLTACQHDTIKDAQRSLGAQDLYLVTKKVNGRVCYRICVGTFESREAAGRALAGLPGEYRTAGASVRPVADVLERDR